MNFPTFRILAGLTFLLTIPLDMKVIILAIVIVVESKSFKLAETGVYLPLTEGFDIVAFREV